MVTAGKYAERRFDARMGMRRHRFEPDLQQAIQGLPRHSLIGRCLSRQCFAEQRQKQTKGLCKITDFIRRYWYALRIRLFYVKHTMLLQKKVG